jgi:glycosyltransferase involved in cell wall biosynthesis
MLFFYASERPCYPLSFDGGAETTVYTVIEGLALKGIHSIQVSVLPAAFVTTYQKRIIDESGLEIFTDQQHILVKEISIPVPDLFVGLRKNGILILSVERNNFYSYCSMLLKTLMPELVISFLKGSETIQREAALLGIRSIHWVFSIGADNLPVLPASATVFANSPVTSAACRTEYKREVYYLPSVVRPDLYWTSARSPHYVTYINPRAEKGLHLFCEFCRLLPAIPFLVVLGWSQSKLSQEEVRAIDFLTSLPNVKIIGPVSDMKEVYAKTRILVVPSRWMEAFGRIVLEAQLNGIPVLASNRGNLPFTVGQGGLILPYGLPQLWARSLRILYSDQGLLDELSGKAKGNAEKYDATAIVANIYCFFIQVAGSAERIQTKLQETAGRFNIVSDKPGLVYSIESLDVNDQLMQEEPLLP